MNEEDSIYRESFHLTLAKNMGFLGAKKSQKVTFLASHHAHCAFSMHLGALGQAKNALGPLFMRQSL